MRNIFWPVRLMGQRRKSPSPNHLIIPHGMIATARNWAKLERQQGDYELLIVIYCRPLPARYPTAFVAEEIDYLSPDMFSVRTWRHLRPRQSFFDHVIRRCQLDNCRPLVIHSHPVRRRSQLQFSHNDLCFLEMLRIGLQETTGRSEMMAGLTTHNLHLNRARYWSWDGQNSHRVQVRFRRGRKT